MYKKHVVRNFKMAERMSDTPQDGGVSICESALVNP